VNAAVVAAGVLVDASARAVLMPTLAAGAAVIFGAAIDGAVRDVKDQRAAASVHRTIVARWCDTEGLVPMAQQLKRQ
jgi:hypothetical protein